MGLNFERWRRFVGQGREGKGFYAVGLFVSTGFVIFCGGNKCYFHPWTYRCRMAINLAGRLIYALEREFFG